MAEQWLEASKASELAESTSLLLARLQAGLIPVRARTIHIDEEPRNPPSIPASFWAAGLYDDFCADWEAGDFSAVVSGQQWQVFGLQLACSGVLALLPAERRGIAARALSVASNADWLSAKAARAYAYTFGGANPTSAGDVLVQQGRLGFLTARAVLAQGTPGGRDNTDWTWEEREWDVQPWFWEDFTADGSSSQEWETGTFSGRGVGPNGLRRITLTGVYFLAASLDPTVPGSQPAGSALTSGLPSKPALATAELQRWWEKKAKVREQLGEADLVAMVRAAYPESHVSRERIRELMGPRKTGPK
ncbi:MAG: hypothetical protein ABI240_14690 [Sphingomonas sp.]